MNDVQTVPLFDGQTGQELARCDITITRDDRWPQIIHYNGMSFARDMGRYVRCDEHAATGRAVAG